MNKRLEKLVKQAGMEITEIGTLGTKYIVYSFPDQLERFAALVRADALEEAIRLLEELELEQTNQCLLEVSDCIDEIRQLKDKP